MQPDRVFISFPTTKFLTCEKVWLKGFLLVSESEACSGGSTWGVSLRSHSNFGSLALFEHCGVRSPAVGDSRDQSIYFLHANSLLGVFLRSCCTIILECNHLLRGTTPGMIPASRLLWICARPVPFVRRITRSPQA